MNNKYSDEEIIDRINKLYDKLKDVNIFMIQAYICGLIRAEDDVTSNQLGDDVVSPSWFINSGFFDSVTYYYQLLIIFEYLNKYSIDIVYGYITNMSEDMDIDEIFNEMENILKNAKKYKDK